MSEPSWLDDAMAGSLLEDVPATAFRAIVNLLSSQEHASLRQINRSVCKRATQQISCICMRLTEASSDEQLSRWHQATRQLRHVTSIHIQVAGKVSADMFDSAMQLLSQSFPKVAELQLLGEDAVRRTSSFKPFPACIPTLQPLGHLMGRLEALVIQGMTIADIAQDLLQLAASTAIDCRQLRELTLQWRYPSATLWSDFLKVVKQLPLTFPVLQQLHLCFPAFAIIPLDADSADDIAEALQDVDDDNEQDVPSGHQHLLRSAIVAALVNAVMQMDCLKVLSIQHVPDMWHWSMYVQPLGTSSPADAATAAIVNATIDGGRLPDASAAVAAFPTLDHLGCWLLQHHVSLKRLQIATDTGCSISWQRPPQQQQPNSDHGMCSTLSNSSMVSATQEGEAELVDACISHDTITTFWPDTVSSPWQLYSFRPDALMQCVSKCQLRLERDSTEHEYKDMSDLLGPWISLKGLKHLEVGMCHARRLFVRTTAPLLASAAAAAAEVVLAASTVNGLQSLSVAFCPDTGVLLADKQLLPLIAVGGGPGRTLQKLTLDADIVIPTVAAEGSLRVKRRALRWRERSVPKHCKRKYSLISQVADDLGAQNTLDHATDGLAALSCRDEHLSVTDTANAQTKRQVQAATRVIKHLESTLLHTAAAVCPGTGWHYALQQLDCLRELNVTHRGDKLLEFPVASLPASLKVLTGNRLNLFSASVVSAPAAVVSAAVQAMLCSANRSLQLTARGNSGDYIDDGSAAHGLRLLELSLTGCTFSSPDILASNQLQQLTLINSSWAGGWAAGAAAWPAVRQLVWRYDAGSCSSNHISSSMSPGSAMPSFMEVLQSVTGGFKHLRKLIIQQPLSPPAASVLHALPFLVLIQAVNTDDDQDWY